MTMNDTPSRRAIRQSSGPYFREAGYCLIIDLIILIAIIVVFALLRIGKDTLVFLISFIGLFVFVIEILTNFRLSILLSIDRIFKSYRSETLCIVEVKPESSWSGHLFQSVIPKLYPKELQMDRYRLICIDKAGKKSKLRLAMSRKRFEMMMDLFVIQQVFPAITIHYLRISRVVFQVSADERRMDERQKKNIPYRLLDFNRMI